MVFWLFLPPQLPLSFSFDCGFSLFRYASDGRRQRRCMTRHRNPKPGDDRLEPRSKSFLFFSYSRAIALHFFPPLLFSSSTTPKKHSPPPPSPLSLHHHQRNKSNNSAPPSASRSSARSSARSRASPPTSAASASCSRRAARSARCGSRRRSSGRTRAARPSARRSPTCFARRSRENEIEWEDAENDDVRAREREGVERESENSPPPPFFSFVRFFLLFRFSPCFLLLFVFFFHL